MAGLPANVAAGRNVDPQTYREILHMFASTGNYLQTAEAFGLHDEQVRRIIKSPQGSFALEQLLRERARTRALKLGALTDRAIDEMDTCLTNGNERILNSRRDGDPITVFLRPDIKDLTGALAWMTHHMREVSETLSAIDVTNHDVSHEARSQNLTTLKELVALEERRLLLDAERQAADAPPVDVADDVSPWSRPRWGALSATPHRRVASTDDGDTREPVGSSSAPDAEAALMHAPARDGSHNQPAPPTQAREATNETRGDIRSSNEVTWDDLEEE